MCGIAGFFNPSADYTKEKNYRNHILEMMNQVQKHRGPDDEVSYSVDCSGFMRFFQTFALSLRFEKIEFEESI